MDPDTKAMVMIGEIGGTMEEEAAAFISDHVSKPVAGYIAGRTAPPGKRMGHAGAIVEGALGTADSKMQALAAGGARIAKTFLEIPKILNDLGIKPVNEPKVKS